VHSFESLQSAHTLLQLASAGAAASSTYATEIHRRSNAAQLDQTVKSRKSCMCNVCVVQPESKPNTHARNPSILGV
jgi:glycogen synthase